MRVNQFLRRRGKTVRCCETLQELLMSSSDRGEATCRARERAARRRQPPGPADAPIPMRIGSTACSARARATRRSPRICTPGRTTRTGRTGCATRCEDEDEAAGTPNRRPAAMPAASPRASSARRWRAPAVSAPRERAARTLQPLDERRPLLDVLLRDVALHLVHADAQLRGAHVVLRVADASRRSGIPSVCRKRISDW